MHWQHFAYVVLLLFGPPQTTIYLHSVLPIYDKGWFYNCSKVLSRYNKIILIYSSLASFYSCPLKLLFQTGYCTCSFTFRGSAVFHHLGGLYKDKNLFDALNQVMWLIVLPVNELLPSPNPPHPTRTFHFSIQSHLLCIIQWCNLTRYNFELRKYWLLYQSTESSLVWLVLCRLHACMHG